MVWCPYCGEPLTYDKNYVKGWKFKSPKGGVEFTAKIYQCHRCNKKVRITVTEKDENELTRKLT